MYKDFCPTKQTRISAKKTAYTQQKKLNYRKKVFFSSSIYLPLSVRDVLLMKKLEIEETQTTKYSTFKTDINKWA